jgi:hypothetical protein
MCALTALLGLGISCIPEFKDVGATELPQLLSWLHNGLYRPSSALASSWDSGLYNRFQMSLMLEQCLQKQLKGLPTTVCQHSEGLWHLVLSW